MTSPTYDRRDFCNIIAGIFAGATLPGCGDRPNTAPQVRTPDGSLTVARAKLVDRGYAVAVDQVVRADADGIVYFIGDVHTAEYRKDVVSLLMDLAADHGIESVGIEGLYGEPRTSIVDERYETIARIVGSEACARIRESEESLFAPLKPFVEGEVLSIKRPVKVFGLEVYEDFIRLEIVSHQLDYVDALIERFTKALKDDPSMLRGKVSAFLQDDAGARELNKELSELVKRVRSDRQLAAAVIGRVPLYSEDLFKDPAKLGQFLTVLRSMKSEEALSARDVVAARQTSAHTAGSQGNHAVLMGWYHLAFLLEKSQKSALIVHPVRDPEARRELGEAYDGILLKKGRRLRFD